MSQFLYIFLNLYFILLYGYVGSINTQKAEGNYKLEDTVSWFFVTCGTIYTKSTHPASSILNHLSSL